MYKTNSFANCLLLPEWVRNESVISTHNTFELGTILHRICSTHHKVWPFTARHTTQPRIDKRFYTSSVTRLVDCNEIEVERHVGSSMVVLDWFHKGPIIYLNHHEADNKEAEELSPNCMRNDTLENKNLR